MRRLGRSTLLLAAGLVVGPLAAPLAAQGVTTTSVTRMNAAGALGALLRLGGARPSTTTTYIAGHKMQVDQAETSTIWDLDAGRFITINRKEKTYSSMTFEQMAAMMDSASAAMTRSRAESARERARQTPAERPAQDSIELHYTVKAEPTNEHQKIAGYDARRQFVTITFAGQKKGQPTGPDQGEIVVLMDMWMSTDAPNAVATRAFAEAFAERARRPFREPTANLSAALAGNPQMKEAFEASAKELSKVQGTPLRSTTYFVGVPEGAAFDRQVALNEGEKADADEAKKGGSKGGLGGLLNRMKQAAEQQQQQDTTKQAAKQGTLMSFTTEVQDIHQGVPAGIFSVPAGYRELPNPYQAR